MPVGVSRGDAGAPCRWCAGADASCTVRDAARLRIVDAAADGEGHATADGCRWPATGAAKDCRRP